MKLFTKDIDKKLFAQFPKGGELANQKVIAKIFNPYGRGVWYIINSDPHDPDYLWAIVNLFEVEVGSVSRKEIESLRIKPFMLPLERDLSFRERNALEVYEGASQGQRFEDGGEMDDDEGVDLFEDYEDQPEEVSELLSTLEVEDYNYDSLNDLLAEMKKIGYTFDFGLDAEPYDLRKIGQKGKSEFYAKGGIVVTKISNIPNFKQRLADGKITYRGLGMGKISDDFYNLAGEHGTRIKVDGKEYYITDTEFDSFSRGADGKLIIRFDAPYRKSYAEGGKLDESTKMVLSQNKAIAHHTEELKRALKKDPNVEPWVIGKVGRAETDISDVTHYLDGRSEYARGGVMKKLKITLYESKLMAEKGKRVLVSHDAQQFYTIEEGVLYKTDDDLNHQEKFDMDKIDLTIKPMESYGGKYKKGGLTFDEKVKAVEKLLMSREVPKKYRNSYGKTFNKAEAHESAQKIIGAQVKKYNKK